MKILVKILAVVALLCVAGVAFIALHLFDAKESEARARQTEPARNAKLAKKQVAQEQSNPTEDENKEQVV